MLLKIGIFAALGGFLYGYDLGLIGGALFNIRDEFHLSKTAEEWVVGLAKVGAFFGTFLGGAMMLHYGRRKTIAIDSIFYMAGPVVMAASYNLTLLCFGRFLVGIGIGISAVVVPVYLGEVAPAQLRGRLVLLYELLLCGGMLGSLLADTALMHVPNNWRWMVGLPVIPAAVLAVSLFILPESPRWLVVNGHLDMALAVIHRVFTKSVLPAGAHSSTAEVEHELMDLWNAVEKDKVVQAARRAAVARNKTRMDPAQPPLKKATRLFGKAPAKFHTLEYGAQGLEDPQVEVPKELQEGPSPLDDSRRQGDATLDEAEQAQSRLQESDGQARQPEIQEGQEVQEEGSSRRQEAGSEHTATAAALQLQDAAGDPSGGQRPAQLAGPHGRGEWGASLQEEADPVSPASSSGSALDPQLFRSLSEVPKGLRPIRTTSGRAGTAAADDEEQQVKGFVKRLRRARQQALRQTGKQHATQPTPARNEQLGYWNTLWVMLLDIYVVLTGPERRAVRMALWLAFFDQGCASTAIINYAPQVLEAAGITDYGDATLWSSGITAAKIVGVGLSVFLIDTAGRRPLLIWGGSSAAISMLLLSVADRLAQPVLVLMAMCLFIASFSLSYAGVFWVLVSEIFSMSSKSPAASAATAMLFLAGAAANLVFLSLHEWLGSASFLVFGGVAGAGAVYCYINVPETMGKTLAEIQCLLGSDAKAEGGAVSSVEALPRVPPPGQHGSRQASLEVQPPDHPQSRMESGLLSNRSAEASALVHAAQSEALPRHDQSSSLLDRLRLHWFNWSGYQQYRPGPAADM
ncbi:hypothetical protein ABBQ32_009439 [Trebouxia sp. C0010 RCD-2024]